MVIVIEAGNAEEALGLIEAAGLDAEVWGERSLGKRVEWEPGMDAYLEADEDVRQLLVEEQVDFELEG